MARITRKELKSDKFAEEVGLTVTFFEEHQKDLVRYGGIGLAVVVLVGGFFVYRNHEHAAREQALAMAIRIQETPVADVAVGGQQTFPSQAVKDQAAIKAFSDLEARYGGSDEAQIAEYYLGCIHSDEGKLPEAEKNFQNVADHGNQSYGSLGKLALAEIYFSEGRFDQGKKILEDLMAHPTAFVSKDQAALTLAKHLIGHDNAEARKLLAPIRESKSPVATIAQTLSAQLPPQ
ncbi:MAG TPA: tetratricopeptide repeat protein [Bryobacteraceae bacterium]|nr:tetratricopeptide repeat protein [Bryobacteraceae bacterium]